MPSSAYAKTSFGASQLWGSVAIPSSSGLKGFREKNGDDFGGLFQKYIT
jgi:hypothetical protein